MVNLCDGADVCKSGGTAPVYTVTVLATRVGQGSRLKGNQREVGRKKHGRYCVECLRAAEFRVSGAELLDALAPGR